MSNKEPDKKSRIKVTWAAPLEHVNSIVGAQDARQNLVAHMKQNHPKVGFSVGIGIDPEDGKYSLEIRLTRAQVQHAKLFPDWFSGYKVHVALSEPSARGSKE